jgi:hypothetical protein
LSPGFLAFSSTDDCRNGLEYCSSLTRRTITGPFNLQLEAHPVVPGSSTYRGGGPNLKRGWVSSFRVP